MAEHDIECVKDELPSFRWVTPDAAEIERIRAALGRHQLRQNERESRQINARRRREDLT